MAGTLPWYVARASGLIAWSLLAGAVVWGLLMTSKIMRRRVKNSWLLDLHRWLGGLALVFTGVHIIAILGDTYIHFGVASVLIPFAARWHPLAVAWGVASLYLLAAVELTSLIRRHLDYRWWKRVHFLSLPLFVTSTVHGVSAGTDGSQPMVIVAAVMVTAAVAGLVVLRLSQGGDRSEMEVRRPVVRPGPGPAATQEPARRERELTRR